MIHAIATFFVGIAAAANAFLGGLLSPNYGTSLTTINGSDTISSSRTVINDNFTALEASKLDKTATTLPSSFLASSLTSVGTIGTGIWRGTAIEVGYGGTGTTSPTANQVILGNGASGLKVVNGFGTSGQFLTSNGASAAPTWQSSTVNVNDNYDWTGLHTFTTTGFIANASTTFSNATTTFAGGVVGISDYQVFTATSTTGTWTKPTGVSNNSITIVELWGGGGGGGKNAGGGAEGGAGGGGGAYFKTMFLTSSLPSTVTVTVGAGGTRGTSGVAGGVGGTSSFGTYAYAYGGGGGFATDGNNVNAGGGGGGQYGAGGSATSGAGGSGGSFGGGAHAADSTSGMGGGGGGNYGEKGGSSVYGGGGGCALANVSDAGDSIYGGGAGASVGCTSVGTSVYGGNGGAAGGGEGSARGGGGGGGTSVAGVGGRGEVRVYTIK